jgi:hypothetical protein
MQRHMDAEHGGCYEIYLKRAEGKASPLWSELSTAGLEAGDLRCGVCSKQLKLHPASILQHMRPHNGDTKSRFREVASIKTGVVGMLRLTLQLEQPSEQLEDADELTD